jgi:uncharacterized protein YecT (DUF1311 family)
LIPRDRVDSIGPFMAHKPVMTVRMVLLMLGFVCALVISPLAAQPRLSSASRKQQTDAQLNGTYQQLMKTLPTAAREQLRKAERAWLEFVVRNRAALLAAAPRIGVSASRYEDFDEAEFMNRADQLGAISTRAQTGEEQSSSRLARTDEELNVVYQRSLGTVTAEGAQKLRNAQKAWIAFRDQNRAFGPYLVLLITSDRITQLNNFYIEAGEVSSLPKMPQPAPIAAEKADSSVPDPFERAR